MEYLELGASPANEDCVQVGSDNYRELALEECRRYKRQLIKQFQESYDTGLIGFQIKAFPHDFGSYYEVCVLFNEDDEKSCQLAYDVEAQAWPEWRDENATV